MKMKCWFLNGACIHIGEWELRPAPKIERREFKDSLSGAMKSVEIVAGVENTNPIPTGATSEEREVTVNANGRFLASDHASLRRPEYPPIREQLDALWKGGADVEDMRARVMAIKSKYPKATS